MRTYRITPSHLAHKLRTSAAGVDPAGDGRRIKRRRFYLYSETPGGGWAPNGAVPSIDIEDGRLFVNGVEIVEPRIARSSISWRQQARTPAGDHFTAGHVFLHANGLEAHGVVTLGANAKDAQEHHVLAAALPTVKYTTIITSKKWPADTLPNHVPQDGWMPGLSLEISFEQQVGSSAPSPVVRLGGEDVSSQCAWTVDPTHTFLTIALSNTDCALAPHLYGHAKVAFDAYALESPGIGTVSKMCSKPQAPSDGVWLWVAQRAADDQPRQMATDGRRAGTTRIALTASHLLAGGADPHLSVADLMTILPDDEVNKDVMSMLVRNMKWAMGQDATQRDWLARFFNEEPPTIAEADQQALVKQSLDWYQKELAMAYLTQSFNSYKGPNEPARRLSSSQDAKLQNYLKVGIARERDFNVQNMGVFADAYVGVKTRLRDYLNDTSSAAVGWAQGTVVFTRRDTTADVAIPAGAGVQTATGILYTTQAETTLKAGKAESDAVAVAAVESGAGSIVAANTLVVFSDPIKGIDGVSNLVATTLVADSGGLKWGKSLFTALTTGMPFTLMVNRVAGAAGDSTAMEPLNNYACLLTALDRSGTLASNYFQSVLSGVLVKLIPDVVHSDRDTIMEWLPAAMLELLRKLANGELPAEADISQAEASEMYQEYLKHQAEFCLAMADLLQSISAVGLLKQAEAAEARFAETIGARWPKLAKAGRFIFVMGWIGAVGSIIMALVKGDWKKMTTVEKTEFVTSIVQLTVSGFDAVPLIWQGLKGVKPMSLKLWSLIVKAWNRIKTLRSIDITRATLADNPNDVLLEESTQMKQVLEESGSTGEALGRGTLWSRIFAEGKLAGVLKCVGVVLAFAMAGFAAWQLAEDIMNNGSVSTVVFDVMVFAANYLSAVFLLLDLVTGLSVFGPLGAICAIIGLILALIANFLEKPKNPIDDWMNEHGFPFVDGLPAEAT